MDIRNFLVKRNKFTSLHTLATLEAGSSESTTAMQVFEPQCECDSVNVDRSDIDTAVVDIGHGKPHLPAQDRELPDTSVEQGTSNAVPLPAYFDRPSDIGSNIPVQCVMEINAYPQSMFGRKMRRFNPNWFCGRDWLEYSVSRDAVFCFACYKMSNFLVARQAEADVIFTRRGYRNWKKGLDLHETSKAHCTAVLLWKESLLRHSTGKEISTMVNDEQLARNRYYVQSLFDVVFFLVSNELPLRGERESEALSKLHLDNIDDLSTDDEPCGLFIKLFQFTMAKDSKLRNIYDTIPSNASYTSPQVQNEIIELLANLVREQIATELGDGWYTLLCDGTRDVTGVENLSIVIRYISNVSDVCERLLCIGTTSQFDAANLTERIISYLKLYSIRLDRMLAQCYDGASVMSGRYGGVQALMQKELKRQIPYIHCFNHQLHLVVAHAMSFVPAVASFFDICEQLYNFFRRPNIRAMYEGESLKRVLEQRWEGHLAAARTLDRSIGDVAQVLKACAKKTGEIGVIAVGLETKIVDQQFLFLLKCMPDLLGKLDAPNKALQSRTASFQEAIDLVQETKCIILDMKTQDSFQFYWNQVDKVSQTLVFLSILFYVRFLVCVLVLRLGWL